MSDVLQFAIVTVAAGAALAAIVRPYFRRAPIRPGEACVTCPSGRRALRQQTAASADVRPLRLIRR
jgi:hypothetical protein